MKPESPSAWLVAPVLPVVVVDDAEAALFIAGAFLEAGLKQIEITLRSPASMKALEAVARRFPTMKVAAGTVLEPAQVAAARNAGATLCVSPGFTPALAQACRPSRCRGCRASPRPATSCARARPATAC